MIILFTSNVHLLMTLLLISPHTIRNKTFLDVAPLDKYTKNDEKSNPDVEVGKLFLTHITSTTEKPSPMHNGTLENKYISYH